MTTAQRSQQPAGAAQRAQVARALQAAQTRAKRSQKGHEGAVPVSPEVITPTFRGPRSVLLLLGENAQVAIPAGSRVSIGTNPKAAVVLDAEKILHVLIVQGAEVMEIGNLPREYLNDLRRRAFPTRTT